MKITVIICTYNHCGSLSKTLETVACSSMPNQTDWDVLVVDNNSTDQTRDVVEQFRRTYPGTFRYLFEPQPGKSFALNSGLRYAAADICAFLDDDVTVERTWLHNLTGSLYAGQWLGTGGRIILEWPSLLPKWLATKGPYARTPFPDFDDGDEPKDLARPPFGANMAFRAEAFKNYGYFRTDLGPSPNREVPCPNEDVEFCCRVMSAGERLRYEPSAIVRHPIAPNRIGRKYFLNWWFDEGRASIRAFGVRPGTKWYVAGIPLYLIRSLVLWAIRWTTAISPCARFYYKIVVWGKLGGIVECYRQARKSLSQGELQCTPPPVILKNR